MHQLAEYNSDDDSPYSRYPRGNQPQNKGNGQNSDNGSSSNRKRRVSSSRSERRRNSEYWTDDSAGASASSASSKASSVNSERTAEDVMAPPRKKRSSERRSSSGHSNHSGRSEPYKKPDHLLLSRSTMSITQSQASLVSYGAQDEEEDQFAKADRRAVASKHSERQKRGGSTSTNREPKPPPGHEDSRSPDEIAIDQVLEDSLNDAASERQTNDQAHGGETPRSIEGCDSPATIEELTEIRIPPAPAEKCSRELEDRFRVFFAKKASGVDLNSLIQKRRDYKNPSMYEKLIEKFEVDELGSNFPPSVFNPHGFTKDCFYDQISNLQKEAMEKFNATTAKKVAPTVSSKNADAKRKSRFEGGKK